MPFRVEAAPVLSADDFGGVWVSQATHSEDTTYRRRLSRFNGGAWIDVTTLGIAPESIRAIVPRPDGTVTVLDHSGRSWTGSGAGWTERPGPHFGTELFQLVSTSLSPDGVLWAIFADQWTEAPALVGALDADGWDLYDTTDGLPGDAGVWGVAVTKHGVFVGGGGLLVRRDDAWEEIDLGIDPGTPWVHPLIVLSSEVWVADMGAGDRSAVWRYRDGAIVRYDASTGAPGEITDATPGPAGTVWMSTRFGTVYFDGATWVKVDSRPSVAVAWDGVGTVWYALQTPGSELSAPFTDTSQVYGVTLADGTWAVTEAAVAPTSTVAALAAEADGTLWVASDYRGLEASPLDPPLVRFDGTDWRTVDEFPGRGGAHVVDIEVSAEGSVWVVGALSEALTDSGFLARLDGSEWTRYDEAVGDGRWVDSFWSSGDGEMFLATFLVDRPDLLRFDGANWAPVALNLPQGVWGWIAVSPDGTVWMGTTQGLFRVTTR
jgi:hypothetical protein